MTEPKQFKYDTFLSHSSKDKPIVRDLANRLQSDGLKVSFDGLPSAPPAVYTMGLSLPMRCQLKLLNS